MNQVQNIQHLITPVPAVLRPDTTLQEASVILIESGISGLPVQEGNKVVGIFSERDAICGFFHAKESSVTTSRVSKYMSKNVTILSTNTTIDQALEIFTLQHYQIYPVFNDQDELIGLLNRGTFFKEVQGMFHE